MKADKFWRALFAWTPFDDFRDWLCRKFGCNQPKTLVVVFQIGNEQPKEK